MSCFFNIKFLFDVVLLGKVSLRAALDGKGQTVSKKIGNSALLFPRGLYSMSASPGNPLHALWPSSLIFDSPVSCSLGLSCIFPLRGSDVFSGSPGF